MYVSDTCVRTPPTEYTSSVGYRSSAAGGSVKGPPRDRLLPVSGPSRLFLHKKACLSQPGVNTHVALFYFHCATTKKKKHKKRKNRHRDI